MGNSTRCHAVMEYLAEQGVEIHVLTSGNGLTYFRDKKEIASLTPMDAFFYSGSHGHVSGWRTLAALRRLHRLAHKKREQLAALLAKIKPDVAVTDSEYAVAPLRHRGIPIIGLNNSDVIVSEYLNGRPTPRSIRSQFWVVEFADYLYHKRVCDMVISPAAVRIPPRHPRVQRVGMIIRRAVRETLVRHPPREFPRPGEIKSVVFMLSGSIFASHIAFGDGQFPFHVDVVGREGESRGQITFHGRLMNNIELLGKADALVINGGFSAVSEAAALHKPTLVIPVPGHAEQWVNARALADLGGGYVTDEAGVLELVQRLYRLNRWEGLTAPGLAVNPDGAREAADFISELLEARRTRTPGGTPAAICPGN